MPFEQPQKETPYTAEPSGSRPLEHKDISGERRPKYASPEVSRRARAGFFFGLMEKTLRNYDEARKQNPGKEKSPLQNLGFFFKTSWDDFTEPLLEYEDMLAEIMAKKWESNGAKSRALNSLKERQAKTLEGIKIVMPDFEDLDSEKQKKAIAKLYEGYAGFIHENEHKFGMLAEEVSKGFLHHLRSDLRTENDELLKKDIEAMLINEKRKKEARKARKIQEAAGKGGG